jgi:hypothetical protein
MADEHKKKDPADVAFLTCLPDTINPRGPRPVRRQPAASTPLDDLLAAHHRRSPVRLLVREPGAELPASPFEPPPASDVPFGF